VYECQGRGSLHIHYLLWSGPTPEVFGAATITGMNDLRESCSSYLDSVCISQIPRDSFVEGQSRRIAREPAKRFGMTVSEIPDVFMRMNND
jgi:hypothetical protein